MDAAFDTITGSWTEVGNACGPHGDPTAFASSRTLVPGGTARFGVRGGPGEVAVLALAAAVQTRALPLAFVGSARDCYLHLFGILATTTTTVGPQASAANAFHGGFANAAAAIPNDPGLFGARFAAQWILIGTTLTSSNAVECRLAQGIPSLGMATVSSKPGSPPGLGDVSTVRAPVLRFDYR